VARFADHWNYSGMDPDEFGRLRERLGELCEAEGRALADIELSAMVRPDADGPGSVVDQASAFEAAGAQRLLVGFPRPYDPGLLEPVASVLAPLAG
jgi:hypothetical protein